MGEGLLSPEAKRIFIGPIINFFLRPWRILAVLLTVLAFSPDFDENGFIWTIVIAVMLFLWDGPKTLWGYVIAVVISVVAAGFTYWLIRL
jgi:hypothetical protein